MRIIAGTHRHRSLLSPPDAATTRPITDRVKQSLFDRLTALGVFGDLPPTDDAGEPLPSADDAATETPTNLSALDIFAGTGSMGIEALSRGAIHCTFIERDRRIREILERNLDKLDLVVHSQVLGIDALTGGWITQLSHRPVGLVFCDPPYAFMEQEPSRQRIQEMLTSLATAPGLLATGAVLILRTPAKIEVMEIEGWGRGDHRRIGSMRLGYFVRD